MNENRSLLSNSLIPLLISYITSAIAYYKLLKLSQYKSPLRAFIPFSSAYFLGYLSYSKNMQLPKDVLHKEKHKNGIKKFIWFTIIPLICIIGMAVFIVSTIFQYRDITDYTSLFLQLGPIFLLLIIGLLYFGIWYLIVMYKMYVHFTTTNIKAILWIFFQLVIAVIASEIKNELISYIVSCVSLTIFTIFALTRKFYKYSIRDNEEKE
ncbi:hypothetical protein H1220_06155 [Carnobacteriaceae bacterium zg-84]|uniref:hypothetical protein n=1 Tax=Granulicatella sp. zg-84 TaxID=2678503 RepID=UPI0013C13E8D|nr:hypothetical protein [Granulicatella sp. zg-84]NEW66719.1 hypothetical protein [Granulicatella sp. zg-84]QMI85303.1 hypothetical protein H1220_06155 [Carnobacteriaceae bacterium zg-84]